MKDDKGDKSGWEDLVFNTISKIAAAPSKFKDPKESVSQAFEWVKNVRDDLQDKVVADVTEKFKQLDWDLLAKKVAEHLAENFDVEVSAKISLKPKSRKRDSSKKENP